MIFNSPIYPICPSFDEDTLEISSTINYLKFLEYEGVKHIMTTAGTSQFNLLEKKEIRKLNLSLLNFNGNKIIGMPPLSLKHTKEEIEFYNKSFKNEKNIFFLILFPERYYTDDQIINYFEEISLISDFPVLAHSNILRKGSGGNYIYENNLFNKLSLIPNFIGIKEESPTIDFSIEEIGDTNLEIIVAGGSMRRYWCLEPFGATTYLSGVGSFFPHIEEDFYKEYKNNNMFNAKKIIQDVELPIFKTFMKIGWHASMREVLKNMGFIKENRYPFVELSPQQKKELNKVISNIKENENFYHRSL